jgi:hypothetical protein
VTTENPFDNDSGRSAEDCPVKLPLHMVEVVNKLMWARRRLLHELGREPTVGVLSEDDTTRFHLPESELSEWRFVKEENLDEYVTPVMARRLRASLASTEFVYLEEGHPR